MEFIYGDTIPNEVRFLTEHLFSATNPEEYHRLTFGQARLVLQCAGYELSRDRMVHFNVLVGSGLGSKIALTTSILLPDESSWSDEKTREYCRMKAMTEAPRLDLRDCGIEIVVQDEVWSVREVGE